MNDPQDDNIIPLRPRAEALPTQPKKRRSRHDDALVIRDAVLAAIRPRLVFTEHPNHFGIGRNYHGGGFNLLYVEPFEMGRYGLDIWPIGSNKVMNIWWGAVTGFEILSFRRGDWELQLLSFIAKGLGVSLPDINPLPVTAKVLPFLTAKD